LLISRAPLRVSLFGGGSDLPAYLRRNDGAVLSFAIKHSVFVIGHPFKHRNGLLLKYSRTEDVSEPEMLTHPIAREVFRRYSINHFDVAVMSDVPAGTGLGSSSAFTVACLAFARAASQHESTAFDLAYEAADIEINVLGEPIGRQDQWASAYGDLNRLSFSGSSVRVEKIAISSEVRRKLETNLFLVAVGSPRRANDVLVRHLESFDKGSKAEEITRRIASMVNEGVAALQRNIDDIGPLLHRAWRLKREVSSHVSNSTVDEMYEDGLSAGATGGKLLGAGGSGYMLFYVPEASQQGFADRFRGAFRIEISFAGGGIIHDS
jgi:D-glycero-alpha-D-manno-heptose-7-phosphate kinase